MKVLYKKILEKALPLYLKGRKGDVEHIKWLFKIITKYVDKSEIDYDVLIPVVILHDVGYFKMPKGYNCFDLKIRRLHSEEGAKIAEKILVELSYPNKKIKEVKRLILKHDNWAFGDSFENETVLRVFSNFDFIWSASKEGFDIVRGFTGKTPQDAYREIEEYQEEGKREGRKWFNAKVGNFYARLMEDRRKEIFG